MSGNKDRLGTATNHLTICNRTDLTGIAEVLSQMSVTVLCSFFSHVQIKKRSKIGVSFCHAVLDAKPRTDDIKNNPERTSMRPLLKK